MRFLLAILFVLPLYTHAQSIGVKDIPADEDTTISVKKGNQTTPEYQVIDGGDEVTGDEAPLLKDARANWKSACADWKKEIKENNKDNSVLNVNCGKMECGTAAMETTCSSKGTYKIKTRVK